MGFGQRFFVRAAGPGRVPMKRPAEYPSLILLLCMSEGEMHRRRLLPTADDVWDQNSVRGQDPDSPDLRRPKKERRAEKEEGRPHLLNARLWSGVYVCWVLPWRSLLRVLLIGSIAAEFGLRAPIKNDRVVSWDLQICFSICLKWSLVFLFPLVESFLYTNGCLTMNERVDDWCRLRIKHYRSGLVSKCRLERNLDHTSYWWWKYQSKSGPLSRR